LATDGPLLAVEGLVAGYGSHQVLRGVDLAVRRGEVVALLGANGSGKSTALNTISGFIRPMAGRIRLDGQDIAGYPPHRTFRRGIVQVSQARDLFPDMTVEDNLQLGGAIRGEARTGWVELHRKSGAANGFPRQSLKNRITEAMLGTLAVPTLVISGVADLSTPPAIARLIAAKIPNAELVVAQESGHSVYWEEPELFNRAVLSFIAKHGR